MIRRREPPAEVAAPGSRGRRLPVGLGLAVCAALAPLGLILPDGGRLLATLPAGAGAGLFVALLLAPAAAGFVVALKGIPAVLAAFAQRGDSEHEQITIRIFFGTVVFAYTLALAWRFPDRGELVAAAAIAALGSALSWLLLAAVALRPERNAARRVAAMLLDVAALSFFLHYGSGLTAAWYPVYLWVTLGNGFRYGLRSMLLSGGLSVAGFGLVIATTPFWSDNLAMASGLMLALIVLPAYLSTLIRGLTAAKAAAEEANVAKGRFLAIMSHELRTPLNTVIGMGALIERTRLDADQRDLLGTMQLGAKTLLALINDILDFSKMEAGRFEPDVESFDLHEIAHSALAMMRAEAAAKGLQLGLRIAPDVPPALRGWPQQLRQILINLVANAVKFTDKGRVQVIVEMVSRTEETVHLRIAVRDQGIGIPEEALGRIFDLFIQADGAVTRRYGGTGLGLAIVKQLVTLMEGEVWVESAVGKGSTFTLDLPFRIDQAAAARPLDLRGRLIAVVTADEAFAAELDRRLRGWNAEPRWLGPPAAAIERLAETGAALGRPVVVVDARRDPVDALAFGRHLAGELEALDPAIFFVADPDASEAVSALAESILATVLPAPLDETALANALRIVPPGAAPPPRVSAAARAPVAVAGTPRRVLVAEDNAANRKIMKRLLESAGHEVVLVEDGDAALDALERLDFDIVLMDINMPELSGYEAAKLYRMTHADQPRLPIVALTADATTETERLCREAGMDAVLTKPIDAEAVLAMLDGIGDRADALPARRAAQGGGAPAAAEPPPARARPATPAAAAISSVVTPISAHPRFPAELGAVLDEAAIAALRSLGDGSDFFADVIQTFRGDARIILEAVRQAAAAGDARAFREHAHALRSSAANVGGARLCAALLELRDVTAAELRQQGGDMVERITTELARLDVALDQQIEGDGDAA